MNVQSYNQLIDAIDAITSVTENRLEKKLIISQYLAFTLPDDELFLVLNDYPDLLSSETIRKIRQELILKLCR